jgi:hypothetical protein
MVIPMVGRGGSSTASAATAFSQKGFPDATVRCFALVRTISTGDVDAIFAPTAGTITYRDGLLMRQP